MSTDPGTLRLLRSLPELLEQVVDGIGGLRARPNGRAGTAWEAPLPLNVDAFDHAAALWDALLVTAGDVANAAEAQLPGPADRAWRAARGRFVGLPVGADPADVRADARDVVEWILYVVDRHQLADEVLAHVIGTARSIAPRYPVRDRPRTSKDAVCREDRGELTIRPPRHHGDEQTATCGLCDRVYTQDELVALTAWWAAVCEYAAAAAQSRRVRDRLARKYGLSA